MIEFDILFRLFEYLSNRMGMVAQQDAKSEREIRRALKSIFVAATSTKSYISATRSSEGTFDGERELKLSHLWVEAAGDLKTIDLDLGTVPK